MNYILSFLSSPTFAIVLTLLNLFQWFRSNAKEQTIKNNLFAIRRVLTRIREKEIAHGEIDSVVELVEATLATLGARNPYRDAMKNLIARVHERNVVDSQSTI